MSLRECVWFVCVRVVCVHVGELAGRTRDGAASVQVHVCVCVFALLRPN